MHIKLLGMNKREKGMMRLGKVNKTLKEDHSVDLIGEAWVLNKINRSRDNKNKVLVSVSFKEDLILKI